MSLRINIEDLLSGAVVEGTRLECKRGWNPAAIMRTVCAFANDFENEGSGYIVVGCDEVGGKPVRPVFGFDPSHLEAVEKEMVGYCNLLKPTYFPILSLEAIDGKHVLVIWVPAGSNRPYKVPDDVKTAHKTYNYRIRYLSNTIVPNADQEIELMQLTAKIPFDDRVNTHAELSSLSFSLMREHLEKTKSRLYSESASMGVRALAEKMNLLQGADEHLFVKNVGLLMFADDPEVFYPGVHIDVIEFPQGVAAKEFNEKSFTGPLQKQLIEVLSYIKTNIIKSKVIKYADKEQSDKVFNYPYAAIEEALSNAVYHRNYELRDPIEVRILPNAIEIISFNGVDPSIRQSDFDHGVVRARRYRNRRVGEFLKELRLTEGRGTGIPTIRAALKENGSPPAKFDTNDPERTYFIAELPIHPAFMGPSADQVEVDISALTINRLSDADGLIRSLSSNRWDQVRDQVRDQVVQVNKNVLLVLEHCQTPKSRKEICGLLELTNKDSNFKRYAGEPLELGWIEMTSNPHDSDVKYITTESGKKLLSK